MDADRPAVLSGLALPRAALPGRALPVLLSLAAAIAVLLAVLATIGVRTDMAEFLPRGETEAARLVMEEVRTGTATGLILIGIEGGDPATLAAISKRVAAALPGTGLFQLVAGGDAALPTSELERLFADRYTLAPADWSEGGLRAGMQAVLRQLRSAAAPLAIRFGLADPAGAGLALLRRWTEGGAVRAIDGAWFAPDRDRALLLARTRAGGMDVRAQEDATAAIEAAFRAADPRSARLLIAGPAVFARDAARSIKSDVERISVLSTVLVVTLLVWRFRSPLIIAAIATPVILSVAAAAGAVQALFGEVHGVALGFGATMLGVSVDYPVLMIGHRKQGEPAGNTRARIGRAFVLAVATAALGLAAMIFSGFPGLVQLGVFAAVGLTTCAALTWTLLPRLIVAANLAPVASGDPAWLPRLERLRRWRWLGLVPVASACVYLAAIGGPHWEGNLDNLSPVPAASRALDQELRAELGAPEAGQILLVRGSDAEAVLQRQEALVATLERLRDQGALRGFDMAAQKLPSLATQRARLAALPDAQTLAARVDAARAGLPFRPDAFAPFLQAVADSRAMAPLRPEDFAGTAFGALLAPLLAPRDVGWQGPVILHGVTDPAALTAAFGAAGPDVTYIDMRRELGAILSSDMERAWRWLGWSGLLVSFILAAGMRQRTMVPRVLGAVLAAMLVTAAVLTACGARLSLIHLVALQLVAGVGLDYALFFARRQLDAEERARTLRTLVTCNAMTLLTFGLLAACQTPLLRDIGQTVACGAVLAMVFAFLFAGEARAA